MQLVVGVSFCSSAMWITLSPLSKENGTGTEDEDGVNDDDSWEYDRKSILVRRDVLNKRTK